MDESQYLRLDAELLKSIQAALLKELGVCDESIHHVTKSMMTTSLRGVDSHGVNLFPHYYNAYQGGRLNKNPEFDIVQTKASTFRMDAKNSIGHHSGAFAMSKCIEQAHKSGVAMASVKNSSHFGAAAYFALMAAQNDLIGLSFTNADALVKAHGGRKSFFGTNPICFAAPMADEDPFCLDMATSTISWNKVKNYRRNNDLLEPGWAFDQNGIETNNPHEARSLSPVGNYKGFGLGMMVEILCSVLANSVTANEMLPMFNTPLDTPRLVSHFFIAIDIESFTNKETFKKSLQQLSTELRNMESLDKDQKVMIAGDPEKKMINERMVKGIPVHQEIFNNYLEISKEFSKCQK